MPFYSLDFAVFLIIVLAFYYVLTYKAQNIFLIIASYFFYSWWDWRCAGLLLIVSLINFLGTRAIILSHFRLATLWFCIGSNLLILGFFKYYNFFADSLNSLLLRFDIVPSFPTLAIILPVGISFYTFQSIAFLADVYQGKVSPPRSFITVAAFTSFFPLLLAGPIERAEHMLPQFQNKRIVDTHTFSRGLLLILIGLFKKIAIADAVSAEVDAAFSSIADTPWPELIGGLWYFTIQLYFDFSGYSDIARGVARLLGFNLVVNFNQPLFSSNIAEYWRRWHISLSSWLRDYIYIPLGGNRGGAAKTYRNIIITMLICGLWHGASWTFVLWGLLNGFYLLIYRMFISIVPIAKGKLRKGIWTSIWRVFSAFFLFNVLLIPWLFFRADTIGDALAYLHGIVTLQGEFTNQGFYLCRLTFFIALVLLIDIPQYIKEDHTVFLKWHWSIQGLLYTGIVVLLILMAPHNEMPFIYFQF